MKKLLKKFIPDWIINGYHWKLALIGALIYGFPSRKLKVIGVTGTKGKSTVVMLAEKILEEAGHKVGWVSSISVKVGGKEEFNPANMTMPGRFFIQKTLRQMVKNGCQYAIVEVTSEGVEQYRHRFIKWAGAVFTNLAPEHLESHGGFAKYRAAKFKFFAAVAKNKESFGVYNFDDENVEWFLEYDIKNKYGILKQNNSPQPPLNLRGGETAEAKAEAGEGELCIHRLFISNIQFRPDGSSFSINNVNFKTNLLGEFNIYNCAAAVAVGAACGVSLETAARALEKVKSIPGRLELIDAGQNFTVVVDYAHTPDSFEKIFKIFKEFKNASSSQTRGGLRRGVEDKENTTSPDPSSTEEGRKNFRIISVFGATGGGRDKWKRPELGRLAAENSEVVIITNDDPYEEDPQEIADQVAAGCKNIRPAIILDRRAAITKALSLAQVGDIVLILGKGSEQVIKIDNKKLLWDDRVVVREELAKL